jgi:phage recombination protein Bet
MSALRHHDVVRAEELTPRKTDPTGELTARNGLSGEKIQLIKDTVARGATDAELNLFLYQCSRMGLDPLLKQAHFVKRNQEVDGEWKKIGTLQIGIDGMRLAAQRTGEYGGETDSEWCGPDGEWRDVWLSDEPPMAARVGVYRKGRAEPFRAVARYRSYVQLKRDGTPNRQWTERPDIMLAKCASALAHRKAFPDAFSGVYTEDEVLGGRVVDDGPIIDMPTDDADPLDRMAASLEAAAPPDDADPDVVDLDALMAAAQRAGHTRREVIEAVRDIVGDLKRADWSEGQWQAVTRTLRDLSAQEVDHA